MDAEERRLMTAFENAASDLAALSDELERDRRAMEPAEQLAMQFEIFDARKRLEITSAALHTYRASKL